MSLPTPSDDALAQSQQLCARIRAEIQAAGGWISFARYMELALYTPGLGYYSGGAHKFGPAGDFITSPELTPLFGQALAAQMADILQASAPRILEAGAGTGLLASDLLLQLEQLGSLPDEYCILELSGELRARQAETLAERAPHLATRVRWLDHLPDSFEGAIVANELLDVIPVHLVVWKAEGLMERGVVVADDDSFGWSDRPAEGAVRQAAEALGIPLPDSGEFLSEICLAGPAWVAEWGQRLTRGALILIDYGYPRDEFYLPSRSRGTLMCYYRHHAHSDPFLWPGLTDITAFVDFTAVADAGFAAGLDVLGYTSQAHFLFNCGLLDLLEKRAPHESADYIRAARAAQRLTTPQEMGELFKVVALGKGVPGPLRGFLRGDRLHTL